MPSTLSHTPLAPSWHQTATEGPPTDPDAALGLFQTSDGNYAEICYYDSEDQVWYSAQNPYPYICLPTPILYTEIPYL